MNPLSHPSFPRFEERVAQRLSAGAVEYEDSSIHRPAGQLIDEIQQELEDVCGWAAILWLRLENLKAKAEVADPRPAVACATLPNGLYATAPKDTCPDSD